MNELLNAKSMQDLYRPCPFWSWNDELTPERLVNQVRSMKAAGLGGYFMHARVGLKTPYMGDRWFECVKACVNEGRALGMRPWGYDENGYPSGIADKKVVEENENWRSTWIELIDKATLQKKNWWPEDASYSPEWPILAYYAKEGDTIIRLPDAQGANYALLKKNEMRAADPMNQKAVERFIELTHEEYKKQLGDDLGEDGMPGFFTDEPQLKQFQLPWSEHFLEEFEKHYHYDLLDHVFALKDDSVPDCAAVRHDYWSLVHEMYTLGFAATVHDWCEKNKVKFTGHIMAEDTLIEQMGSTGGEMPFYEYEDIPGMDWLGRRIGSPLAPKQVSSVAEQLGKKQVLSETFALSGWNVSFEDLKWMAEWQYANGVNLLCPHLESYSIRGIRKRDYPASLFIQEPWWDSFSQFTDYISALGSTMASLTYATDVLLLHPLHTAHVLFNGDSACKAVRDLDASLLQDLEALQNQHIPYHLGDEIIIQRHGSVQNDTLKVGLCSYRFVLLPDMDNILSSSVTLLEQYAASGGKIYSCGRLPHLVDGRKSDAVLKLPIRKIRTDEFKKVLDPENKLSVCNEQGEEEKDILTSVRENEEGSRLYFLANESRTKAHTLLVRTGKGEKLMELLLPSFEVRNLIQEDDAYSVSLCPAESAILISSSLAENGNLSVDLTHPEEKVTFLSLPESFSVSKREDNKLTLDHASCKIADGEFGPEKPIIILQKELLDQQLDAPIELKLHFNLSTSKIPQNLSLVSENIPAFQLYVNDQLIDTDVEESYLDPDFKKVFIAKAARLGDNEIRLVGRFWQRRSLYEYLYRPKDLSSNYYAVDFEFEGVTYDTELESLYLLGDFCVSSSSECEATTRQAFFTDAPFKVVDPISRVKKGDITSQGFFFYAGKMDLSWDETIQLEKHTTYRIRMQKPHCPMALLSVNGCAPVILSWGKAQPDITQYLVDGENHFTLTLCSGLRNLLGPHHFKFGESYYVGTTTFANDPGWCEDVEGIHEPLWTDRWCFVEFGVWDE